MRVLFVHGFYQQYGGEDAVVEAEMEALQLAGIETRLYSRHNSETREFGRARMAASGFTAIHSGRTRRELGAVVGEFRPDVAYVHNLYPLISPSAYDTLWEKDVPIVQVMHNFRPFCANGLFYTRGEVCTRCASGNYLPSIVRGCMPRGRAVTSVYAAALWWMRRTGALDRITTFVCLSSFVREMLIEAGLPQHKLAIKPNFIDLTSITPAHEDGTYALFLGRLSPEKGLRTLVEAAKSIPELPVVIAGAGPMEEELKQAARGIPNLRLAGFQSGVAKRELLRGAQCLVLCSEWYENFPVVLLEAFAAGKPVVASDIGSLPRLVDDGETGLLFKTGSARDLAEKLELLSNAPGLRRRMGAAGRRCVEERYAPGRVVDQLLQIFKNATGLGEPRPAPVEDRESAAAQSGHGGEK